MSEVDNPSRAAVGQLEGVGPDREIEFGDLTRWFSRRWVSVAAVVMIVVQLAWKAAFLGRFYFRQDDIHFTELALHSRLGWGYLSYVGSGHLHPGVLLIVWILARAALYDWAAASAVLLVLLAIASIAAWRLLRALIGSRPALLIPLALYLATPLTLPNDSWWQSGIESAPIQAVIFLALLAHIQYVRSGRTRHLVAATAWLAVGLFFFEKAAVIPVILFGVTAGFMVDGPLTVTVRQSLRRYWRAWLAYGGLVAIYGAVLIYALQKSTVKPAPTSFSTGLSFAGNVIKDTLLPGLLGGPLNWWFTPGDAIAYSAPPTQFMWLSLLVVAAIVAASIRTRGAAWRAWAMLAAWIALADLAPVLLGRLNNMGNFTWLFELDTRYVADAAPVAAICVALAFWPVTRPGKAGSQASLLPEPSLAAQPPALAQSSVPAQPSVPAQAPRRPREYFTSQTWRVVGIGLTGVMVICSVISVSRYEGVTATADAAGQRYLANARASLAANLPPGTVIFNEAMPGNIMTTDFYLGDALQSAALGPMATTPTARAVRWTQSPSGNLDNLAMFGTDGTLDRAVIFGAHSVPEPRGAKCWQFRRDRAVIRFVAPSATFTGLVRLGYYSDAAASGGTVTVSYGSMVRQFTIEAGLHSVYLPVTGSATGVTVQVPPPGNVCVGDVEAGNLLPGLPLTSP